jgi:hypothetical protein
MQQFSSLLSWRLFTAQHVLSVVPPIIRSSMTAVAVSGFIFVSWWQSCCFRGRVGRPARPRTQHGYHHDTNVKPEASTAVIELLMMGGTTPATCWIVNKSQDNKLEKCCIWLVMYLNCRKYCSYSRTGHRWQYGACALRPGWQRLQTHKLRICNTHRFSTATMVARTPLSGTLIRTLRVLLFSRTWLYFVTGTLVFKDAHY